MRPIPASAIASSITSSASRSDRAGADSSGTGTKSTVPAMVVRSPSIGKREIRRMPDTPLVSAASCPPGPGPSDVSTPMPVTTTIGRPR